MTTIWGGDGSFHSPQGPERKVIMLATPAAAASLQDQPPIGTWGTGRRTADDGSVKTFVFSLT